MAAIEVGVEDGVVVAGVGGEVDLATAHTVVAELAAAVSTDSPGLVIDMSDLTFLDSSAVGGLFRLGRQLRDRRQGMRLVVPTASPVARVLELVEIGRLAPLHETRADAVAALRR
ncbi:MAG: hypothetical protein QOJ07_443 [Thermoleophilaceae bacterium]|jgi:anti-anti-sigma factor|nr:hypothetical protein [Thermoleophilaceae bacterium]